MVNSAKDLFSSFSAGEADAVASLQGGHLPAIRRQASA